MGRPNPKRTKLEAAAELELPKPSSHSTEGPVDYVTYSDVREKYQPVLDFLNIERAERLVPPLEWRDALIHAGFVTVADMVSRGYNPFGRGQDPHPWTGSTEDRHGVNEHPWGYDWRARSRNSGYWSLFSIGGDASQLLDTSRWKVLQEGEVDDGWGGVAFYTDDTKTSRVYPGYTTEILTQTNWHLYETDSEYADATGDDVQQVVNTLKYFKDTEDPHWENFVSGSTTHFGLGHIPGGGKYGDRLDYWQQVAGIEPAEAVIWNDFEETGDPTRPVAFYLGSEGWSVDEMLSPPELRFDKHGGGWFGDNSGSVVPLEFMETKNPNTHKKE